MVRSGLVESENTGCSIEAMSPFGAASKMSQTKKSAWRMRSGSSGERSRGASISMPAGFVRSPTEVKRFVFSDTVEGLRVITHRQICNRVFAHRVSCIHPPSFVSLHTRRPTLRIHFKALRAFKRALTPYLTLENTRENRHRVRTTLSERLAF